MSGGWRWVFTAQIGDRKFCDIVRVSQRPNLAKVTKVTFFEDLDLNTGDFDGKLELWSRPHVGSGFCNFPCPQCGYKRPEPPPPAPELLERWELKGARITKTTKGYSDYTSTNKITEVEIEYNEAVYTNYLGGTALN